MDKYDVIVIGAGPAGMMAAGVCAARGKNVLLIEKNERPGKKLRITGKGRCNVTNNCEIDELIKNTTVNGRFLYSAFNTFDAQSTMEFFESLGVKLKTERGKRVFPVSDKAQDIVDAMVRFLSLNGVKKACAKVSDVMTTDGVIKGIILNNNQKIYSDAVVVATGGISYPVTGSTGDGYRFAKACGHTVTELSASLVPLVSHDDFIPSLKGLSLKNVSVALYEGQKKVYTDFGEMMFTHFGLTGPVILSSSSHMKKNRSYTIKIDLKPALTYEMLDKRLVRDFEKYARRDFVNALSDLLPQRLISVIVEKSGIPSHKIVCEITKAERQALCKLLKEFTVTIDGFRPLSEAVITAGGVSVKEINPSTMESKLVNGLYFAGEVIDVSAYTGGFNLQIAFSTGYLCGQSI